MSVDIKDRTVLITGANTGIGLATAMAIAKLGARVLLVSRNEERGLKALSQVQFLTGNPKTALLIADLSSQDSIRELTKEVRSRFGGLDVLVNNAAVIPQRRTVTQDGIETQFAVNHLAYFLLTNLLLDVLKLNQPSRVINVSSQAHRWASLDFDDLQSKKRYRRSEVYAKTKLANILFTYELARRLNGVGVTANCLDPGVVSTNLLADFAGIPRLLKFATRVAGMSVEDGARTSTHVAISEVLENVSGKYFVSKQIIDSSPASYDEKSARRLWDISSCLTGL